MNYWLLKTEPETYGWSHLVNKGRDIWDGVRNYAARNNLRAMQVEDLAFFYHSGKNPEIVGIVKVTAAAFNDPNDDSGT